MFLNTPVKFDAPASYRIIVQGLLPETYYPYFGGMKIVEKKNNKGIDTTSITGTVKDQAALAGMLNMLYEFRYSILLVEYIEEMSETA